MSSWYTEKYTRLCCLCVHLSQNYKKTKRSATQKVSKLKNAITGTGNERPRSPIEDIEPYRLMSVSPEPSHNRTVEVGTRTHAIAYIEMK